jgi:hypothetical protein
LGTRRQGRGVNTDMDQTLDFTLRDEHLAYEAGGWVICRVPRPELVHLDDKQLLAMSTASRPGNLRWTRANGSPVLLGELFRQNSCPTLNEALRRFALAASAGADPSDVPSAIDVECNLADTHLAWTRKDGEQAWRAVTTGPRAMRCELKAEVRGSGVEISADLAAFEEPPEALPQRALARVLVAASARLRFVRLLLSDRAVRAASFAARDRLEVEVPDSVAAVVSAYGLLWRETRALLSTQVAQAFLAAQESNCDAR